MRDYFLRSTDAEHVRALGIAIGVLQRLEDGSVTIAEGISGVWDELGQIQRPSGAMQLVESPAYTYEQTLTTMDDDGMPVQSVQVIQVPAHSYEAPVMAPITDADGVPYWHANLRLLGDKSLGEMAREAYAANPSPELAAALADLPAYFVTDEDGQPTRPAAPARVFL